jgi:hypothetical protein
MLYFLVNEGEGYKYTLEKHVVFLGKLGPVHELYGQPSYDKQNHYWHYQMKFLQLIFCGVKLHLLGSTNMLC